MQLDLSPSSLFSYLAFILHITLSSFLYVSFFPIVVVGRVSKFNTIRKMKHKEGGNKAYLPTHISY